MNTDGVVQALRHHSIEADRLVGSHICCSATHVRCSTRESRVQIFDLGVILLMHPDERALTHKLPYKLRSILQLLHCLRAHLRGRPQELQAVDSLTIHRKHI